MGSSTSQFKQNDANVGAPGGPPVQRASRVSVTSPATTSSTASTGSSTTSTPESQSASTAATASGTETSGGDANTGDASTDARKSVSIPPVDVKAVADLITVNVASKTTVVSGVSQTLYVLFEIVTGKTKREKRPPVNLSVVLDASGSMQGDKLVHCKRAINEIIDVLEADDLFHMVTYNDKAQTVFAKGDLKKKDGLKKQVDAIKADNGTEIATGLTAGSELTHKHATRAARTKRVFLFSDGQDNNGTGAHEKLFSIATNMREKGVNTTSFGIGADYDEVAMRGIAERGGGNYLYIDQPDNISKLVHKALDSLLSLVGTDVVLKVRGKNGAVVKKVFSHDNKLLVSGIPLGYLREEDTARVLFEVEVSPAKDGPLDVLSWELSMKSADPAVSKPIVLEGSTSVTSSSSDNKEEENAKVAVSLGMFQAKEIDEKVSDAMAKGDRKQALVFKKQAVSILETVSSKDERGMAEKALKSANSHMAQIEADEPLEKVQKALGWAKYQLESQQMDLFE